MPEVLPEGLPEWKYRELASARVAAAEWRFAENAACARVHAQHEAEKDRTAAREELAWKRIGMGRSRDR